MEARSPDLWFLAGEAHRRGHRDAPFRAAVARGVALVGEALGRKEPADVALGRFVAIQIDRRRIDLAAAILREAAAALPDADARVRFEAMRDRLERSR